MTNKLNFRFRKTRAKTNKLQLINSIKQTFFVLKIFIRTIKLGVEIVYLDESGFFKNNDNLRMWLKIGQDVYYEIGYITINNLLLAVTPSKVLRYKLSYEATNSTNFESFMNEMIQKLTLEEKRNYIFFLDNCSSQGTINLFNFYQKNGMKILFNTPYRSNFNMVELLFRHINRETYTHIYDNYEEIKNTIEGILDGVSIKNSLKYFYKATLKVYNNFILSYQNINLNQ